MIRPRDGGGRTVDVHVPFGTGPSMADGFSFIEVNIAMMITGLLAISLATFYTTANKATTKYADTTVSANLASGLMEEIRGRPWDENGDTGGISSTLGIDTAEVAANKSSFDDVDDFNGYVESGIQYPDGSALSGFTGYTREVTVVFVDVNNVTSAIPTDRKKAVVIVKKDGKERIKLNRLFAQP